MKIEELNSIFGMLGIGAIIYSIVDAILKRKKYKTEVKQATIQNKLDDTRYIDEAIEKTTDTNAMLMQKISAITNDYMEINRKYLEIQQKYNEIYDIVKRYSCTTPECPRRVLYNMHKAVLIKTEPIQDDNKE